MRRPGTWYWVATAILLGFGVLAMASIGLPFVATGLLLAVGGATGWTVRHPRRFWPVVAAVVGLFTGFFAVAPFWCETTEQAVASAEPDAEPGAATGQTRCRSLVGLTSTADAGDEPPAWPAVLAGIGLAVVAAGVTRRSTSRVPAEDAAT